MKSTVLHAEEKGSRDSDGEAAETPTVLSVEDNPINQRLMERMLRRHAFEVLSVGTGKECLASLSQIQPDVILMDIGLPDIDGITLSREVKRNNAWCHIPIIIVSAHATHEHEKKSRDVGCLDFFPKPVDFRALIARLTTLLRDS